MNDLPKPPGKPGGFLHYDADGCCIELFGNGKCEFYYGETLALSISGKWYCSCTYSSSVKAGVES